MIVGGDGDSVSCNSSDDDQDHSKGGHIVFPNNVDVESTMSFGKSASESGRTTSNDDSEVRFIQNLAKEETKRMRFWRFLVFVIMICTGVLVSSLTYKNLAEQEIKNSKEAFILFSRTIEDVSRFNFRNLFESSRAMSRVLTTDALLRNMSFPFCTFPYYEVYAHDARESSGIEEFSYHPLVTVDQADLFVDYVHQNKDWLATSRQVGKTFDPSLDVGDLDDTIHQYIFDANPQAGDLGPSLGEGPFLPLWHPSPPTNNGNYILNNLAGDPITTKMLSAAEKLRDTVLGQPTSFLSTLVDGILGEEEHKLVHNRRQRGDETGTSTKTSTVLQPHGDLAQPVFRSLAKDSDVVGFLVGIIAFDAYLVDLLPKGVRGIYVVVDNTCSFQSSLTYKLTGSKAEFIGEGDHHETRFERYRQTITFDDNYINAADAKKTPGHCVYSYRVYPSEMFVSDYVSSLPIVSTVLVAAVFGLMASTFFIFLVFVERRNNKVVGAAAKSNAIVSSLFPANVRARLFETDNDESGDQPEAHQGRQGAETEDDGIVLRTKPIADLFVETTVLFADISGFTAWSSVRDPAQVFTLLETVYRAFDEIATRRKVFKVETVGDCYVAVCGLPVKRKDHAVVMARFSRDCMARMDWLCKKLEVRLGPDTGDLSIRIGIHSGPVTAGVLRGERSRFQLFGDTVNTASRLESTGIRGRIHLSQETASLLEKAGKSNWLEPREDTVHAKGKGYMTTYWLHLNPSRRGSSTPSSNGNSSTTDQPIKPELPKMPTKIARLIDWNVDVLHSLLRQIVARRNAMQVTSEVQGTDPPRQNGNSILDEVQEIITLPTFDAAAAGSQEDQRLIVLDEDVITELRNFVSVIAGLYRDNPFHNFEHAAHVTMSVTKLLKRIVASSDVVDFHASEEEKSVKRRAAVESTKFLHDHTYGITSDPLTQFACVLSALIHDVDHPGVPNAQLVKEKTGLSVLYKNKSVAEQNSVDLAWNILMGSTFANLRRAIYASQAEMQRFRQLVVNSVMATDIVDKELKGLRNARWEKAFSDNGTSTSILNSSPRDDINRKATIVIEHLIQASDVAHTMQHWHIYRKWNERFFFECYKAYKDGRADKDPTDGWFEGELGFFDFYIIPLAKKLKNCGVFGVSCDEYLNYAMQNRREWEARGREVVKSMVEAIELEDSSGKGDLLASKVAAWKKDAANSRNHR